MTSAPDHHHLPFLTQPLQYNSLPRLEGVIFLLFFRAFHGYHLLLNALSAISYRPWASAVQSRWGPYGHRAQTPKFILPKKEFDTTPWTIITKQRETNILMSIMFMLISQQFQFINLYKMGKISQLTNNTPENLFSHVKFNKSLDCNFDICFLCKFNCKKWKIRVQNFAQSHQFLKHVCKGQSDKCYGSLISRQAA